MGSIKKTYTIVFDKFHDGSPVRPEEEQVASFLERTYGYTKGLHYEYFTINTLRNHNTNNKMAKKTTTEQSTELALFEQEASKINLPEIPKVINIGGIDFSEAEIQKAVDEVKKIKLDVPRPDDTLTVVEEKRKQYEFLKEKKNQFVKTRTQPDKFRQEVTKPINAWAKSLKAQTDAYGNIAQQGQEHCESQIYVWENWEAEQERIKQEATQKIVNERTAELQKVSGVLNPASLHWTFEHNPSKIVEHLFLESADDSEWNGLMKELEDSFEADKQAKIKKEQEFEAAKNAVYNTRLQMLQMAGGYESSENGFTKNGHTLTEEQIRNTPEADWFPLVMSHQQVKEAPANPFASPAPQASAPVETVSTPVSSAPTAGSNPFAAFAPKQEEPEQVSENPFGGAEAQPKEAGALTYWDKQDFVEKELGKTTLRVFPQENQGVAMEGIHDVKFDGTFDNGLMFVIYAK